MPTRPILTSSPVPSSRDMPSIARDDGLMTVMANATDIVTKALTAERTLIGWRAVPPALAENSCGCFLPDLTRFTTMQCGAARRSRETKVRVCLLSARAASAAHCERLYNADV